MPRAEMYVIQVINSRLLSCIACVHLPFSYASRDIIRRIFVPILIKNPFLSTLYILSVVTWYSSMTSFNYNKSIISKTLDVLFPNII